MPGASLIQTRHKGVAEAVLAPKAHGALVLDEALRDDPVDFWVLFGSANSFVGGIGQVDYCAANMFLDSFAHMKASRGQLVVTIDWAEWQWDSWQNRLDFLDDKVRTFMRENRERYGLSFEEGLEAMHRCLSIGIPQVIVSKHEIHEWVAAQSNLGTSEIMDQMDQIAHGDQEIAPPSMDLTLDEIIEIIRTEWIAALGTSDIGLDDNFLDIGGDSLRALQVCSAISKRVGVRVKLDELIYSTLVRIARTIKTNIRGETASDEQLPTEQNELFMEVLAEVEALSSEEVRRQISEERSGQKEDRNG